MVLTINMAKKSLAKKSTAQEISPPLIADLTKLCYDNGMLIPINYYILNSEKQAGLPWSTYLTKSSSDLIDKVVIYIANDNYEKYGSLNKFYITNNPVSILLLESLFMTLPKYDTLSTLKIEYCGLTASQIAVVALILNEFKNIFDVSLDGNPNNRQNFAMVLNETNLKHLSLKRCKITEYGLEKICQKLWYNSNDSLVTLNLTGNYIDDNAVVHLAKMLRQNRLLRMINLADNWITDVGCYELMKPLQNFSLTPDEIAEKRKEKLHYFMLKAKLTAEFKKDHANDKFESAISLDKFKSSSTRRMTKREKRKSSQLSESMLFEKYLNIYLDENLPKKLHPFITEVSETMGVILCNDNKITSNGYRSIINALNYQYFNNFTDEGLTFVALEGNSDLYTNEFNDIYKLLMEKKMRFLASTSSKSTILNQKTSSKYNNILM